jgi:hypothetical protein
VRPCSQASRRCKRCRPPNHSNPTKKRSSCPARRAPPTNGRIEVDIHAWIFERERRWGLNGALARYLGLNLKNALARGAAALQPAHRAVPCGVRRRQADRRRLRRHADPREDAASTADGRTNLRVVVDAPRTAAPVQWLQFHGVTGPGELLHRFRGQALVVPPEGVSVISDIDDTIKRTQVRDRREMLLNTFARRFEAAPRMAAYYRALAQVPDTRFHYLSASPIQLYPALADFVRDNDFPAGSMHLRESTTWRTLIPGAEDSRAHKLGVIDRLLTEFPQRRFVLVGDSGEADPEIYAQVYRANPQRIDSIVIRDVTDEGRLSDRYRATFEGIDAVLWHILMPDTTAWPLQASR